MAYVKVKPPVGTIPRYETSQLAIFAPIPKSEALWADLDILQATALFRRLVDIAKLRAQLGHTAGAICAKGVRLRSLCHLTEKSKHSGAKGSQAPMSSTIAADGAVHA